MGPATDYSSEDKTTIQLDDEFHQFDGVGLSELVKNGEVTASELVDVVIQRIERVNPKLNFVSTETYDLAYQAAQRSIPDGPFSGVPYLMKDMGVKWQGVPLTNGSVAYKDSISKADCFDGIKAKAAGFILTATTTAPEGAWSGSTESDLQGATLNPWDITRTPGGSSGGSAAAVAARVVPLASGSDGGGSLRIPASFTGILGLKPTRGRIQFGPLVPEGQNGFITRGCMSLTVRDSAAYLDAFCGNYPGDAYICHPPEDSFLSLSSRDVGKLRIGVTTQCPSGTEVWGPAINAVRETAALCENLGHNIEKINYRFDYEHLAEIVTRLEAVHHARDFEAIKLHLGREPVEGEIMRFLHMSAEYGRSQSALQYAQDIASMRLLAREIAVETEAYDVVLTPTMPVKPPKIGWLDMNNTPFDLYNQELCKKILPFGMPFNCSGAPAISVPLGFCNKEQLPVGVQFIGKYGDDALLLQLANQLEKEKPWAEMIPPVNALPKTIV